MLAETLFFFLFSFFHTVNLPCGSYHYFATSFNTKKNWRSTNRLWYNYKNEEKLLRLIIGFLGACRNNKGQPILILLRGQFYNTQVLHTHTKKRAGEGGVRHNSRYANDSLHGPSPFARFTRWWEQPSTTRALIFSPFAWICITLRDVTPKAGRGEQPAYRSQSRPRLPCLVFFWRSAFKWTVIVGYSCWKYPGHINRKHETTICLYLHLCTEIKVTAKIAGFDLLLKAISQAL